MLSPFIKDDRGSIAMKAAGGAFAVIAVSAVCVDGGHLYMAKASLQTAADAAALAAAPLAEISQSQGVLRANQLAELNVSNVRYGDVLSDEDVVYGFWNNDTRAFTPNAAPANAVEVTTRYDAPTFFAVIFGVSEIRLEATAIAQIAIAQIANAIPCILALDPDANRGIALDSNAEIWAPGCRVHANSTSSSAINALSNSEITAGEISAAGGAAGGSHHYNPQPKTHQEAIADPLADLVPPTVGHCDHNDFSIIDLTTEVNPGVYCGGLFIDGNARVTFNPGIYVIKNGPFRIYSNSQANGAGVSFYLTGANAQLDFDSNTSIDWVAPSTGSMAGVLFFEDRSVQPLQTHDMDSNTVGKLEGSIYLSRGILSMDSNTIIAADSAFTNIVVQRLSLNSNADLHVNVNHSATSVPNLLLRRQASLVR